MEIAAPESYLSEDELIRRIQKNLNESDVEREGVLSARRFEPGDIQTDSGKEGSDNSDNQIQGREIGPQFINNNIYSNSFSYFEKLKRELLQAKKTQKEMKPAVGEQSEEDFTKSETKTMRTSVKISPMPKTIHAASTSSSPQDNDSGSQGEHSDGKAKDNLESKRKKERVEEILFRDVDDFAVLDEGSEISKDKESEPGKVYITKKEKRYFEDIGQLASRTRVPLDEKQQRYFEKDRRKYDLKVEMPETREIDKKEGVPKDVINRTKEIPINITSTELDGLKGYLLQLKELIARRETTWAKTTERDYSQRVEITRFKNEVSHLRMLCDKRTRELREKEHIIQTKDDEIKELNKKVNQLKSAYSKVDKKSIENKRLMDAVGDELGGRRPMEPVRMPAQFVPPPAEPKPAKKTTKPLTAPSSLKLTPNPFTAFTALKSRDSSTKSTKDKVRDVKTEPSPDTKSDKKPSNQRKMKSSVLQQAMNEDAKSPEKKINSKVNMEGASKEKDSTEKTQKVEEVSQEEVPKKKSNLKSIGRLTPALFQSHDERMVFDSGFAPKRSSPSSSLLRPGGMDILGALTSAAARRKTRTTPKMQGPASIFQNSLFPGSTFSPLR